MQRSVFFLALVLLATTVPAFAQTPKFALWKAEMPGGNYAVRCDRIASVSLHTYTVNATMDVTEMTIATDTAVVARFYYIEPKTPSGPGGVGDSVIRSVKDKAQQALEKANKQASDVINTQVVKDYPVTTHAHTVEYRLGSAEAIQAAYDSAFQSWTTLRPGEYKVE